MTDMIDVEETLGRELREVADGLHIPAMPSLPEEPARPRRSVRPLLMAAAVVLIVAVAVAVTAMVRGGQDLEPAPPSPSPSPSPTRAESAERIPKTAPTVPYVLDDRLYVDGEQVPGPLWRVWSGDEGWIAISTDNTWSWGRGPEPHDLAGPLDVSPVISPNGRYVGEALVENGEGLVTGFDIAHGEGLGGVPVDLGSSEDGSTVSVRAVTNDGKVIAQGTNTSLLWLPLAGNGTVDLAVTAPDQQFLGSTAAGLVVTDGEGGQPYLAEISDTGEVNRIGTLPPHDDLVVSPGGEWLAWVPAGMLGGEVAALPTLEVQAVDGTERATLTAPAGWAFHVHQWVWEDDDHLVAAVDGPDGERMARCATTGRCVLIRSS